MYSKSLKTNIAVTLAILLLIAMLLTDFVIVITSQKHFIQSEISRANFLSSIIERNLFSLSESQVPTIKPGFKKDLDHILDGSDFSCTLVVDGSGNQLYFNGNNNQLKQALVTNSDKSIQSGAPSVSFQGSTWGVFWKQDQHLIVSTPIRIKGEIAAITSMVLQLDEYYHHLRTSQQIVFVYILINALILTFVGFSRINKVAVKPIGRLVKRAEEYTSEDDFSFLYEKEKNEFGMLSKSLNRMLKRISEDKEALQKSLKSLGHANLEIKQAQSEIIRAEKLASVGRLSAGLAHEIGNPIGIVLGYLGLMKQYNTSEEERKDYITRSENEINRINTIIRQLLDFSRPSEEVKKKVPVHEIIDEVGHILNVQPLLKNINVNQELSAEKDTVFADPNHLRQVFLNVMMNAADAISCSNSEKQGEIIIQSEIVLHAGQYSLEAPMLKIRFSDNGSGIPDESLSSIFDPFYTTKEPGKGTGLGLSVCYMIMEEIGGSIKADSIKGEGTTITIHMPIHEGDSE